MSKPEHLIRMEKEFDELSDRVEKLSNFISFSPKGGQLSELEKALMLEQICGMRKYRLALWSRIRLTHNED
ncbi:hypothetical protein ACED34_18865 [Vibrio splendidus]|uniref:crAss001_48 related protein n=1 Tax=Vibrio splendidus TaxID=29497 RepID=UPI00352F28A5